MGNAAKYAGRLLKKAAKAPFKLTESALHDYGELGADAIEKLGEPTAKFVGKQLFKKEDKTFWNGYTGLKETGALKTAAWVGTVGWGIGSVGYRQNTLDKSQTNMTYANEPDALTYDYVSSSSSSLGATGSLVFGLHNGRRG